MHQIEISYRSTNIRPIVPLILFFRLNGIYVSEKFFDYGSEEERFLMAGFPDVNKSFEDKRMRETQTPDMYFYVIEGMDDFYAFIRMQIESEIVPEKYIFIDATEGFALSRKLKDVYDVVCIKYDKDLELLSKIIDILGSDESERVCLHYVADVYCGKEIWCTSLMGKYFYPADTQERFDKVAVAYTKAVSALKQQLEQYRLEFAGGKYLQYAICNLMYETNIYYMKNGRTGVYRPQSIVMPLLEMLDKMKSHSGYAGSVQLLLAQIYEDLFKEPNIAYKNYLSLCREPYSAFVFMKKAEYWRTFGKNNKYAIKYNTMSVAHFLEYYQAWFNLGICYVQAGGYAEALHAFQKVKIILKNRRRASVLRPMEMEYLFKSYCCSGYIEYNYFRDIDRAIKEDMEAEHIWDEIEYSNYYKMLGNEQDYIKKKIKMQFNIGYLYRIIYKLANKSGDHYLAEEYYKRMRGASDEMIS